MKNMKSRKAVGSEVIAVEVQRCLEDCLTESLRVKACLINGEEVYWYRRERKGMKVGKSKTISV